MNKFNYLQEEKTEDTEIQNDKQLRNCKKKLTKKQQKKDKTEQDKRCIKMLQTEIYEYENKFNIPQKKPKQKNKESRKNKEDDDLLNEEYEKNYRANKEKWEKLQQERQQEQQRRQQEQQRRQQEQQRRQQERQQERQQRRQQKRKRDQRCTQTEEDISIPEDVRDFMKNYSKQGYRKLLLKYHPDKGGDGDICKILNDTREKHEF